MSRLALYCDRLMEATWLLILTTSPLYFDVLSSRIFEPDKATILRSLTIVLALAWAIKAFEGERIRIGGRPQASGSKEVTQPNPLLWPVVFLVGMVILATAFSLTPRISIFGSYQRLQGTITFLCYVVLFFAIAGNLRSREQLNRLLTVAILTSIPVALYGVAQKMGIDPLPWGSDVTQRVASTMGNPIFVAAYLIMVVPLTLAKVGEAIWRLARQPQAVQATVDWRAVLVTVAAVAGQNLVLAYLLYATGPNLSVWWVALPAMVLVLLLSLWVASQRSTPGLWLLQALGIALVLGLQLVTIFLTGSQGPWLGLTAGLAVFFALGAFVIGRPSWKVAVAALFVVAVLLGALTFVRPVGPLQQVRQAVAAQFETGTGKVRVLIWQGVADLMRIRPEIGPEGDRWSLLRPLVGYGPEALYYAYNPVYPPELAHYEARNATPDRSHNEILDRLSMTGMLGLSGYLLVLNVFFWFVLVRLGLIEPRHRRWATPLLIVLGPVGVLAHLVWMGFRGGRWRAPPLSWGAFLSVALFSAVVAHAVETQVGISIVSTLTYFWTALGLAVALPRMAAVEPAGELAAERVPVVEIAGGSGPIVGSQRTSLSRRERKRRPPKAAPQAVSPAWVGQASPVTLAVVSGYTSITLFVMLVLSRAAPVEQARGALSLSFLWMAVGLVVVALVLPREGPAMAWRGQQWWLYAPLAFLAGVGIWIALSVVAADMYYKQAQVFERGGRAPESIAAHQRAIGAAPSEDFYYLMLSRNLVEQAKRAPSASGAAPTQYTAAQVLGSNPAQLAGLNRENLLSAAVALLERARELTPLNVDHYSNLAVVHTFWAQLGASEHMEMALRYYELTAKLSPNAAHQQVAWGYGLLLAGRPEEALARAQRATELDDRFPPDFVLQGDAYWALGQGELAVASHARAVELSPTALADDRFEQRIAAYAASPYASGMVEAFQKAIALHPREQTFQLHNGLAFLLSRLGRLPEAVTEFQVAAEINPRDWLTRRNLAVLNRDLGRLNEAVLQAQMTLQLAPQEERANAQQFLADLQQLRGP